MGVCMMRWTNDDWLLHSGWMSSGTPCVRLASRLWCCGEHIEPLGCWGWWFTTIVSLKGILCSQTSLCFLLFFLFACFVSVVRRGSVRFYLGTDQRQRIQVTSWSQSSKTGSPNTLFLFLSWWSQLLVKKATESWPKNWLLKEKRMF